MRQPGGIPPPPSSATQGVVVSILLAITVSHLLNDTMQQLVVALYPAFKSTYHLSFAQIGLLGLTYQLTASLLQPVVGYVTDRQAMPYSLPVGMAFTLIGLLVLAAAPTFHILLVASALVGIGSSVFHPEASRVARLSSGGRHGLAQSVFQVGGNLGSSLGPLLAAIIIVPRGLPTIGYFSLVALCGMVLLVLVGRWYAHHQRQHAASGLRPVAASPLPARKIALAMAVLAVLVFSKYFYMASVTNYYTFYLIDRFQVSLKVAQFHLFAFLFAAALGTILGGPIGDRFGRKLVIWLSILGVAPFTILLPYADLFWTNILAIVIGLILSSAFSAILVFAQELIPGRVGMVSGLFFGFAFGMAGIGAAALGHLADGKGLLFVYELCSYLPLLGICTIFLPRLQRARSSR
jgi:FSR family fosmidomycin resistance protein-like MFS transporter